MQALELRVFLSSTISATADTVIQAENFDDGVEGAAYHDVEAANLGHAYRTTGVDLQTTGDAGGGYNVGYIKGGEWLKFSVNVGTGGKYTLTERVASPGVGGLSHFELDGVRLTNSSAAPNTGGWTNWQTANIGTVNLPAGAHVLKLVFESNGQSTYWGNLNWFRLSPVQSPPPVVVPPPPVAVPSPPVTVPPPVTPPPPLPPVGTSTPFNGAAFIVAANGSSTIQAETFDVGADGVAYHDTDAGNSGNAYRSTGVDIQTSNDVGTGYHVGYIKAGEWLNYTINVAAEGDYTLDARVASPAAGARFHIALDAGDLTSQLAVPNTGNWSYWQTVHAGVVHLTAGQHVLRLAFDANSTNGFVGNVNYLRFIPTTAPTQWSLATTPPMGWNSYDAFGTSVIEAEVLANARYLRDNLLSHGYQYVTVDADWYYNGLPGSTLAADTFGRFVPNTDRFPSALDGNGLKALGDQLHAMGLKFGLHIMRGIPRQSVKANTPIEGSSFHTADAVDMSSTSAWNYDTYGVDTSKPAGQAWYDSIFRQYAAWGVDMIKVDDVSAPYHGGEIEEIRRAIDKAGRPMVLSLSPGIAPVEQADAFTANANMWRITHDIWDVWSNIDSEFDTLSAWRGQGGVGRWLDLDMLPVGRVAIRSFRGGTDHYTHLTHDEQTTMMSLWSLASSPLIVGANLPDNDAFTNSLLTNDEVIAIDQDALGNTPTLISPAGLSEVWSKPLSNGDRAIGLFNRSGQATNVTVIWAQAGLLGNQAARDVWGHADLGTFNGSITRTVPAHGSVLLRLSPTV